MAELKLQWTGATRYTDGSPFGAADFAGYELSVDGQPAVALPVSFQTSNEYEFDLNVLGLSYGSHSATLRTVAVNGQRSDPTGPVTFLVVDDRKPAAPTNLRVV
jgi:hypothetical protein